LIAKRPLPIRVKDADDPAVAEFRDIRERDLVGRTGRFIAEGTVVLNMLALAHAAGRGFLAEKILVLENRLAGLEETLAQFPVDVPVYVAPAEVIDAIAGFHLHRGVLALGRKPVPAPLEEMLAALPQTALVTVLSAISNHDNVGAIFRNSAAFGAGLVILDGQSCDPLYRKAIRVSVGSVLTVPFHHGGSLDEIMTTLDAAGFALWGLSPAGRTSIRDIPAQQRTALLLGTEGEGLPPSLIARINTARIDQMPGLDSLNVATAAALSLHEMSHRMGLLPFSSG
jgi:tRNA G18 (ribose-2'-O)-methylase SpoU